MKLYYDADQDQILIQTDEEGSEPVDITQQAAEAAMFRMIHLFKRNVGTAHGMYPGALSHFVEVSYLCINSEEFVLSLSRNEEEDEEGSLLSDLSRNVSFSAPN